MLGQVPPLSCAHPAPPTLSLCLPLCLSPVPSLPCAPLCAPVAFG